VTSQNGEDGILEYIFKKIPTDNQKYFVEFGAWDGKYLSNCFNLAKNQDWNGIFIEGNTEKFKDLQANVGDLAKVKCINTFVDFSGSTRLETILRSNGCPKNFDLLSIDVDGVDYHLWEDLDFFKPKVVVIEFNPSIPNDVIFIQARDLKVNQGSSLLALILLGKERGYELVCSTSCNGIFVLKEYYSLFGITNNHITVMCSPKCDGRIFHGFDSTVYVSGMPRLIWSNVRLSDLDFQVLPASMRRFDDAQNS